MRIGMRAVIRDVQDYVAGNRDRFDTLDSSRLLAYLYALLITAGGFDGEG